MKQLGKYEIIELIGKGAYAEVYRAIDTTLGRTVALKLLKPALLADEDAVGRFMREARTAANLIHPRIAWVWEVGELEGRFFIAVRYINGQSLDQFLAAQGPLPWAKTQEIFCQIGAALSFAHEQDLVHRDVKPQNVLISKTDGAVLTDFGLVRAMESSGVGTRTGVLMGTPAYMAPEIWRGENAGPAADQYALGCILAELLTGRQLFGAANTPAVILRHMQPPQLPGQWPLDCPAGLSAALHQALNTNPENRFKSVADFVKMVTASPRLALAPDFTTADTHNQPTVEPAPYSPPPGIPRELQKTEIAFPPAAVGSRPQTTARPGTKPPEDARATPVGPPAGVPVAQGASSWNMSKILWQIIRGWFSGTLLVVGLIWGLMFIGAIIMSANTGEFTWELVWSTYESLLYDGTGFAYTLGMSLTNLIGWLSIGLSLRKPLKLTKWETAGIAGGGFLGGGFLISGLIPGIILKKNAQLRKRDILLIFLGWMFTNYIVILFTYLLDLVRSITSSDLLIQFGIASAFAAAVVTMGALGSGMMLFIIDAAQKRAARWSGGAGRQGS